MNYLGHLPQNDPLFEYLKWDIYSRYNCDCSGGIRVFGTNGSNDVYIYEDRNSCIKVVGKFFYSPGRNSWEQAQRRLEREYRNINEFRSYISGVHYAADVLGRNDSLNCLLVVEYCYGEPLDSIIMRSINSGDTSLLYGKLTALAWFLATVHNNSARPVGVDFNGVCVYAGCVLDGLKNIIDHGEKNYFLSLIERWKQKPEMWQDQEVLVHGDATPSNFFFGDGMNVITFDLERVNRTDRVFDTGRLAGELQHFFLRSTGNKYAAEPYIGHFLREYCCHFPDREAAFRSVTARVPFYMAVNLLRIARNSYLDMEYRRKLVNEAKITFERGF